MPPKKGGTAKSKKGKKAAAPAIAPDPDGPFRCFLDEVHYIPRLRTDAVSAVYRSRIDTAIRAFTLAAPPIEASDNFDARECQILEETVKNIPMFIVPDVVRALGLRPTDRQVKQIERMVHCAETPRVSVKARNDTETNGFDEKKKKKTKKGQKKGDGRSKSKNSRGKESKQSDTAVDVEVNKPDTDAAETERSEDDGWIMPKGESVTVGPSKFTSFGSIPMADRRKLEDILIDVFRTGLLVYDPCKVLNERVVARYPARLSSVMEQSRAEDLQAAFDVLWATLGRDISADGARIIDTEALVSFIRNAENVVDSTEPTLSPAELEEFLFSMRDLGTDTVREDVFLLTFSDD